MCAVIIRLSSFPCMRCFIQLSAKVCIPLGQNEKGFIATRYSFVLYIKDVPSSLHSQKYTEGIKLYISFINKTFAIPLQIIYITGSIGLVMYL